MARLLVVHHTPSPATQALLEAVLAGARDPDVEGVEVVTRPALTASPVDVLQADGVLLGTPANIGYMSGALKHFFDGVYYPALQDTRGLPYALWVHGGDDTAGAVRAVERIATGLSWRKVAEALSVTGAPSAADLAAARELGGTVAATLMG
jgi:multimeric flavodoxin WrbA